MDGVTQTHQYTHNRGWHRITPIRWKEYFVFCESSPTLREEFLSVTEDESLGITVKCSIGLCTWDVYSRSLCVSPLEQLQKPGRGVKCGTHVAPGLETEVALSKTRTLSEPVLSGKSYSACLLGELWGPRWEVCENALYTTKCSLVHKCSYH